MDFNVEDLYVDLRPSVGRRLFLKCEGFNFAGSVKLKAATEMVEAKERGGELVPGATLIESSSGNMGVALSVVAASRGYRFVCVTDVRCTPAARRLMEALGSEVHVITEPDPDDGFLGARLSYVRRLCAANPDYLWLNQYANDGNWMGHYRTTGAEIAKAFPTLDVLFVGAGTTGTLMGCAHYFRENQPSVTVVAVDAVGSVTFGTPSDRRLIPGLGTSVRPGILDMSYVDDVVHVSEAETVRMCRRLVSRGFLFGGSTGTVVSGALAWMAANGMGDDVTAVAIAPDLGTNYLETIYNDEWLARSYDPPPLSDQPTWTNRPRSARPRTTR
ncbi:2,3-diaminopropionate biosynthesis protein SbnA [Streptomyces caeruleatus]|uniref:2,3-diaminopropionate biosynthesis protein SbnA n=1 Tax=Streptomyces caeruleatus TaxID=661399 RepID=A0A101TNP9_9ACTN|nr:2,3-diaminopropionate biosynthesis protein SbnA [Streptomyces caeruleatus]KUN95703.1 2,3-diaminopropionate biosynthesis protein SbnA [Streptomyces caeruleatus]